MLFAFSSQFLHFKARPQRGEIILISLDTFNSKWMYIFKSLPQSRDLKCDSSFPIYGSPNKTAILSMPLKREIYLFLPSHQILNLRTSSELRSQGPKKRGRAPSQCFPSQFAQTLMSKLNRADSVASCSGGGRKISLLLNWL